SVERINLLGRHPELESDRHDALNAAPLSHSAAGGEQLQIPSASALVIETFVQRVGHETEQDRDHDGGDPQWRRREVEHDGDKEMSDHEQQRGKQDIENGMGREILQRVLVALQRRIDAIKVPSQLVEFGYDFV